LAINVACVCLCDVGSEQNRIRKIVLSITINWGLRSIRSDRFEKECVFEIFTTFGDSRESSFASNGRLTSQKSRSNRCGLYILI